MPQRAALQRPRRRRTHRHSDDAQLAEAPVLTPATATDLATAQASLRQGGMAGAPAIASIQRLQATVGNHALGRLLQGGGAGTPGGPASPAVPIQRVKTAHDGKHELNPKDNDDADLLGKLDAKAGKAVDDVWFESPEQLQAYLTGQKPEGVGVWNNWWVNFAGRGPVVLGETHGTGRDDFIKALNLSHFLVEGASERSLDEKGGNAGVKDVPGYTNDATSHSRYDGSKGNALENYWVRSAGNMAEYWAKIDGDLGAYDSNASDFPAINKPSELWELIKALYKSNPEGGKGPVAQAFGVAHLAATALLDSGFTEIARAAHKKTPSKEIQASLQKLIDADKSTTAKKLEKAFKDFRVAVEGLGNERFLVEQPDDGELNLVEKAKASNSALAQWASRREFFMLKNLQEALNQNPPPLFITMGEQHAVNREGEIEQMLNKHQGLLLKRGSVNQVAAWRSKRP